MFESKTIMLLILLVVAWLIQLGLSTWQMHRFHGRAQDLRRLGSTMSIGMAGSNWKRKTYVVAVIDQSDVVVAAERLSGFTIFAGLQPVPSVVGWQLDNLGLGTPPAGVSDKTWAAFEQAAGFLKNARDKRSSSIESRVDGSEEDD
ncbi:MAG: hypothetical protein GWP04_01655 [Gammaproteobacteria bacterium]|nr:hypothetical protein [Gammaproteobacteria bacterium]